MKTTVIARIMVLILVLGMLAGCSKEQAKTTQPTGNKVTSPTSTTPHAGGDTPTTPTAPPKDPTSNPMDVDYDHYNLHFKLDSTYAVGLDEADQNIFTFSNDAVSGTVTYGTLSAIGNGATSSEEYARLVESQQTGNKVVVGSSMGISVYAIVTLADGSQFAECLYVHGENAWLVKAQCSDSSNAQNLVFIVGHCSVYHDTTTEG